MPSRRQKTSKDIAIAKARREGRPADSYRHEASNAQAQEASRSHRNGPDLGYLGYLGQAMAKAPGQLKEHLKGISLSTGKQVEEEYQQDSTT